MQNAGNEFVYADFQFINDKFFNYINGLSTVELGSGGGDFHTLHLEKHASKLLCIEYKLLNIYTLRNCRTEKMEILYADYHEAVRTVGEYDAVVMFGILYHSHSPLGLLEDVVNYIKPKIILLNAIHDGPIEVVAADEIPDSNFMNRQISKNSKCSNLVLSISHTIYKKVMQNMGYECLKTLHYKKCYYSAYQLKSN